MTPLTLTVEQVLNLPSLPLELIDCLPDTPGLYFGIAPSHSIPILYVGKASDSLLKRWRTHHRLRDLQVVASIGITVRIAYLELTASDEYLSQQEDFQRRSINPPLNQSPCFDPYVVKLERKLEQRLIDLEEKLSDLENQPLQLALPPADSSGDALEAEKLLYRAFRGFRGSESDFIKQVWGARDYKLGKAELEALKRKFT